MAKNVYALAGSDGFLQLQKLSSLLAALPADIQRFDVDGETAQLADVLDELRSFAMFGPGKVVIVRNADDFVSRYREALEKYAAEPADSAVLVLRLESLPANTRLYKIIAAHGQVEDCKPLEKAALTQWIIRHAAQAHKLQVASAATEALKDMLGSDLARIDSELARLALQLDSPTVTLNDITGTVAFQREQQMWEMTDQLAAGNTAEAVRRWRQLLAADASVEYRAVTWLTMWLERVIKALRMQAEGRHPREIAQQLKLWAPDKAQSFFRTANALGKEGAAEALALLAQVDYRSKTGVGSAADNVERFILSVGSLR